MGGQSLIATSPGSDGTRLRSGHNPGGPRRRASGASAPRVVLVLSMLLLGAGDVLAQDVRSPEVELQRSGVSVLLQAVSPVSERVVWVSGHGGTWLRTEDGGNTWKGGTVAGADTLQFRDVHAISAETAWLLAAGPGEMSRIYRTDDGGDSWRIQWTNDEADGFYDCLSMFDDRRGLVYGDAVEGELRILRTTDGGETWSRLAGERLPPALDGEGGFAASGTCLAIGAENVAWIGTGNAEEARVLRSADRGWSWMASVAPIVAGEAAGITSVAFRDERFGLVVGGHLGKPGERTANVAMTADGGVTWTAGGALRMPGAAYGVAWIPDTHPPVAVAVGPGGADLTLDGGISWLGFDDREWWGLGFASTGAGWLVGPEGRIAKLYFR
ncbi:MAG: oxidoreductase [Gemmatimonadota bacterium]